MVMKKSFNKEGENNMESLKFMFPTTIIDSMNKIYSIKKDESLSNLSAIDIPPVLKYTFKEVNKIKKGIYDKGLLNFYNTITNGIENYNFPYMHENLKTLKIYPIYIRNPRFLRRKVAAYYNCIKNIVRYTKAVKDKVLPHELFHMASTVKRPSDGSIFSGFSQSTNRGNYELLGRGINEGYTQLLTERYFNVGYKVYSIESLIASKLENIIGKENMEKMYFDANLKGLTYELSKYMDEKSIIIFLYAVDCLGELYSQTDINQDFSWIKKAYYYVVEFLMNIKAQKIKEEETNFKFAKRELREFVEEFQYKIVNKQTNEEVILLDQFVIESMINKYIKDFKDFYVFNSLKHI